MAGGNRDWAASLGWIVRHLIQWIRLLVILFGMLLIVRGVWLIFVPAGYIAAGAFVLITMWPRPDRRQ